MNIFANHSHALATLFSLSPFFCSSWNYSTPSAALSSFGAISFARPEPQELPAPFAPTLAQFNLRFLILQKLAATNHPDPLLDPLDRLLVFGESRLTGAPHRQLHIVEPTRHNLWPQFINIYKLRSWYRTTCSVPARRLTVAARWPSCLF